jgi:RNA polymerase sigma-70 factor (ECF subfamily)
VQRERTHHVPDPSGGIAEDRRLVLLARGGDRAAFGELVRKYAGLVRALVSARLGSGPDAEDAAQDVFLRAFERLAGLEDPERFAGWLSTIAVNRALESRRRAGRRRAGSLEALPEEPKAPSAGPSDRAETEEETGRMLERLATLDERTRTVLLLRFRDGMAVKDLAARLGENPPAVAMRISRALRKLRAELDDEVRP